MRRNHGTRPIPNAFVPKSAALSVRCAETALGGLPGDTRGVSEVPLLAFFLNGKGKGKREEK